MVRNALLALALAACSSSSSAGNTCSVTADCDADLQCLDVAQVTGTTCTNVGKACSIVCTDDTSCASLGDGYKCFQGCGAFKTCGATN
ncbi:MAG: hypothetical protein ABI591_14615 [Kofleriaceae bacterium]